MAQKYCVLPGQEPVRIAKKDGRVIIIGKDLREIPEDLVKDALGKGAISEDSLNDLKQRLAGDAGTVKTETGLPVTDVQGITGQTDEQGDGRVDAINAAVAQIVNEGDPVNFTAGNKPKVDAIQAITGFEVTSQERDAAFDVLANEG